MTSLLLNAFYDSGNKIGYALVWICIIVMTIELLYVMLKYVFTSNK